MRHGLRGAIVWALVAYQHEAPFELVGRDGESSSYGSTEAIARGIRTRSVPLAPTLLVQAKIRPVVVLQSRPVATRPEYAALKLTRFSKLNAKKQQRVRDGEARAHVYLPRSRERYGLQEEHAIDLSSLVRIHRSAIATGPVGYLDADELETVGSRLATYLDIDLEPAIAAGVAARWAKLVAAQRARRTD